MFLHRTGNLKLKKKRLKIEILDRNGDKLFEKSDKIMKKKSMGFLTNKID